MYSICTAHTPTVLTECMNTHAGAQHGDTQAEVTLSINILYMQSKILFDPFGLHELSGSESYGSGRYDLTH